jgi:hypothetical protein
MDVLASLPCTCIVGYVAKFFRSVRKESVVVLPNLYSTHRRVIGPLIRIVA